MIENNISPKTRNAILTAQRNEITEYHVYNKLAKRVKHAHNKELLERIASDEKRHYEFWKKYSETDVSPNWWQVWKYSLLSRLFGLTFGVKLMEKGEVKAQEFYTQIAEDIPEAEAIIQEEDKHESELVSLLQEERLSYVGSMVLGLNDALVELTGALAGLTLALQNTRLIGIVGFITGVAAAFSMAASEYLSLKAENAEQSPVKGALYTGIAYLCTVFILIAPYFFLEGLYLCLGLAIAAGIVIIFIFTFYMSVTKDVSFKHRFWEMVFLSLGVATISFGIGYLVRTFFGIEV